MPAKENIVDVIGRNVSGAGADYLPFLYQQHAQKQQAARDDFGRRLNLFQLDQNMRQADTRNRFETKRIEQAGERIGLERDRLELAGEPREFSPPRSVSGLIPWHIAGGGSVDDPFVKQILALMNQISGGQRPAVGGLVSGIGEKVESQTRAYEKAKSAHDVKQRDPVNRGYQLDPSQPGGIALGPEGTKLINPPTEYQGMAPDTSGIVSRGLAVAGDIPGGRQATLQGLSEVGLDEFIQKNFAQELGEREAGKKKGGIKSKIEGFDLSGQGKELRGRIVTWLQQNAVDFDTWDDDLKEKTIKYWTQQFIESEGEQ